MMIPMGHPCLEIHTNYCNFVAIYLAVYPNNANRSCGNAQQPLFALVSKKKQSRMQGKQSILLHLPTKPSMKPTPGSAYLETQQAVHIEA